MRTLLPKTFGQTPITEVAHSKSLKTSQYKSNSRTSNYNLIGSGNSFTESIADINGNQIGTSDSPIDPLLSPLQDNGGQTLTHALLPGSPAIEAGSSSSNLSFDQRDLPRIQDGDGDGVENIDIGAVEFIFSDPNVFDLGAVNFGITVDDHATGTGYIMYSEESVFSRFADHPTYQFSSTNLIAVRFDGTNWQYNDNNDWHNFTPAAGDRLLAAVDFSADTISSLQGTNRNINGIESGFVAGDLVFQANVFQGSANNGKFTVSGTFFEVGN